MKRSKKKWLFVGIAPVLVAPFLISSSTWLCACLPDGTLLHSMIGAYPMDVSIEEARSAFLRRMPIGTPETEIKKQFDQYATKLFDKHCRQAQAISGLACRFEERDVSSLLGNYREGFEIAVHLDSVRALRDVRFEKFREER